MSRHRLVTSDPMRHHRLVTSQAATAGNHPRLAVDVKAERLPTTAANRRRQQTASSVLCSHGNEHSNRQLQLQGAAEVVVVVPVDQQLQLNRLSRSVNCLTICVTFARRWTVCRTT